MQISPILWLAAAVGFLALEASTFNMTSIWFAIGAAAALISCLFTDLFRVQALLFITLCRCAGIPARWQSGLFVTPDDTGCHDWAQFYIAPYGWMYADCSAGASMARAGNEKMRLHYFGNLDTGRMVANRAFEAPFDPPMTGFRSDPYDNQSGECEVDGVGLYGDALDTRKELVDYELLEE